MKTCKECKHYRPRVTENRCGPHGECTSLKFFRGYNGQFGPLNPDYYCSSVVALASDQVQVESDEGWEGWAFEVGPDFGCIHHEEVPHASS